jgi:hypothetical protein
MPCEISVNLKSVRYSAPLPDQSDRKTQNTEVSISGGHRPIGAKLERMVIIESLSMELVSIVIQQPIEPALSSGERQIPIQTSEFHSEIPESQ